MVEIIDVNGTQVHVQGQGEQTIVMLHGWPDTYRLWDPQVGILQSNYRCVRFSLPGYEDGQSRTLYTLEQIVALIDEVVTAVSPNNKVVLMLHDWGCFFGYQFYMRHQDKVEKIIGVDIGDAGSPDHQLSAKVKAFMFTYQMWLATAWKIGGGLGDAMTRKMAKWLHAPGDQKLISASMTYSYYWKWSRTLTGKPLGHLPLDIQCPLLFLYGKNKPGMFHSQPWERKMAAIEGNQVIAFDTRHWVMTEAPDKFNHAITDWLAK
ncbi:hypothetical protein TUM4644_26090 [Shewanella colwelliana]|uniref:alpha/beta fold hydrolase n=1 Tax=Shewanella colwelliana TaxID=23 RepID=UPI001BBD3CD0|nr:alpha/beta hydrolase [Shewanella colwelliana]GIU28431.1 hypothetical protein TUM4644_26090 [Shewanella colwelliana]